MFDVKELFQKSKLIPVIVQDIHTPQVLMLGFANEEAVRKTFETRTAWFWSRSRKQLWNKGETSGNVQHIVNIKADCDRDALVVYVEKDGPACHLGTDSCFNDDIFGNEPFSVQALYSLLEGRKAEKKEGSYTTYLFEKGIDKILKKVGEESTEVIIAGKADDRKETVYEIADLAYHVMVLMVQMGISVEDVLAELASRHVIDKKVKQEKMTE